jgi:hypothetical protein
MNLRRTRLLGPAVLMAMAIYTQPVLAGMTSGHAYVHSVQGEVSITQADGREQPLRAGTRLDSGSVIRTGLGATADLVLGYNRSVLRLTPDSVLRLTKLDEMLIGTEPLTDIRLELLQGALAGSQRKLPAASRLEISTPKGVARIVGTEYYVRADGAVSVISGAVTINWNLPGNGGDVRVTVEAGYTFDPATGTVVPTTPEYLQNIIDHVITTRNNAQVYKIGRATLVIKPEGREVSPTRPKGNNGVGNGEDPQPPGNPPINDGPGTGPGNPGNKGHGN